MGQKFVREVDGVAVQHWCENLTGKRGLADNTAVRHFNVMHHMMEKASTIWAPETGIDRNPASLIEVRRPDDSRERYLSEEELQRMKTSLDDRILRKRTKDLNHEAHCVDRRINRDAFSRDSQTPLARREV